MLDNQTIIGIIDGTQPFESTPATRANLEAVLTGILFRGTASPEAREQLADALALNQDCHGSNVASELCSTLSEICSKPSFNSVSAYFGAIENDPTEYVRISSDTILVLEVPNQRLRVTTVKAEALRQLCEVRDSLISAADNAA